MSCQFPIPAYFCFIFLFEAPNIVGKIFFCLKILLWLFQDHLVPNTQINRSRIWIWIFILTRIKFNHLRIWGVLLLICQGQTLRRSLVIWCIKLEWVLSHFQIISVYYKVSLFHFRTSKCKFR